MAHRDPAIGGAATGAIRELLGSEEAAGGLARDAVGFHHSMEQSCPACSQLSFWTS